MIKALYYGNNRSDIYPGRKYYVISCKKHNMWVRTARFKLEAYIKDFIHFVWTWSYHRDQTSNSNAKRS